MIKCVGPVARMGRRKMHKGFWWGKHEEREYFKIIGVDWMIILKRALIGGL
jgi:hypothetical protein